MEKGEYDSELFKKELIDMVVDLTNEILFPEQYKIQKAIQELGNLDCPKCKTGKLLKGKTAYGCSEYKKTCDFLVPHEVNGFKLTPDNLTTLLTKKHVVLNNENEQLVIQLNDENRVLWD
jgi:DNA topoisomerase-3